MNNKENLTKSILKLMEKSRREYTVSQIAEELDLKRIDVHFTIRTLIDLGKIIPTRKAGNAQMYSHSLYMDDFSN